MSLNELVVRWRFRAHRMQLAHYDSSRAFESRHRVLGIIAIILGALVSAGVLGSIAEDRLNEPLIRVIVGLLSALAATLAGLQTFLMYSEVSEKHRIAGARFAHLKHRLELLMSSERPSDADLNRRLKRMELDCSALREETPSIPDTIWKRIEQQFTLEEHANRYGTSAWSPPA